MSKLSQLAHKFQVKLAQVANQSAPSIPNPNAGPQNGAEAQQRLDGAQLQEVGEAVKADLAGALGMKNLGPEDLKFTQLRYVDSNGKKSIEWGMAVSPAAAKQYQAGVANQRTGNPGFAVARYVGQLFNQKLPNVPVLPAQAIAIG